METLFYICVALFMRPGRVMASFRKRKGVIVYFNNLGGLVVLVGLWSSQWLLFIAYILVSVVSGAFKLHKGPKWAVVVDGIVCYSLVLFILVNKYHLHYGMGEIFRFVF